MGGDIGTMQNRVDKAAKTGPRRRAETRARAKNQTGTKRKQCSKNHMRGCNLGQCLPPDACRMEEAEGYLPDLDTSRRTHALDA